MAAAVNLGSEFRGEFGDGAHTVQDDVGALLGHVLRSPVGDAAGDQEETERKSQPRPEQGRQSAIGSHEMDLLCGEGTLRKALAVR